MKFNVFILLFLFISVNVCAQDAAQGAAVSDKELQRQEEMQEKEHKKQEEAKKRAEKKQEKEEQKLEREERRRKAAEKEPYSALVLDYNLRFQAAAYSNLNYRDAETPEWENIFRQCLSVNIIGKFDDRIEMSAKLASYGLSGNQNEIFAMPYSDNGFSFFLESAYLNFRSEEYALIPYVFTVGKQYFSIGNGLIIDSNRNGFLGARAQADLPLMLSIDAFAAKVDKQDFNIYGGNVKIKTYPLIEIGIYQERNNTGFAYQKGILVDSAAYVIESDVKTFYNIALAGGKNKYNYRLEAAKQTGELVKTSSGTVEYDVYAFLAEGSWQGTFFKRASNAKIMFSYADAENENSFNPTFAKRYDGLQRIGYGTLFAANNTDSLLILPVGYGGINTIGAKFDIAPWNFLQTGIAFYMFSASDAPADAGDPGLAKLYGAKADLGNEFDFFVKYKYIDYFDAGFSFALYTPPSGADKVFSNTEASYLYQIEVSARF